jgi:hypothetical protein
MAKCEWEHVSEDGTVLSFTDEDIHASFSGHDRSGDLREQFIFMKAR